MAKTDIVAQEPVNNLPMVIDYGVDAGAGMENLSKDEFKIPMFRILQSNSPQCKPVSAGGTPGAQQGMILNTATGELFSGDTGLGFVPVQRDHNFVEYVPRDAGGGFVGIHGTDDLMILDLREKQGKFGKLTTPDGTEIIETFYLFGLLVTPDGTVVQGVVPFVSTQISKYQAFMTRYLSITYPNSSGKKVRPPLWAHRWKLTTVAQANKKGDFFGWKLALEEEPAVKSRMRLDDDMYILGRAFFDMLEEGVVKVEHAADATAPGDDNIPF